MMQIHEYHAFELRIEIKMNDLPYDIHEFTSYIRSISIIFGLKIDPYNDQFPVCLIAQLVEHCPGIEQVWVRILV